MKKLKLIKIIANSLLIISVLVLNPIGASAEWKQDSTGWWYADGSSWSTGWKQIDGKWYYFNSDGYMVHDTTVNEYYLSRSGAWTGNLPNAANQSDSNSYVNLSNATSASNFTFDATTGTITKYTGTGATVVLPSIINGVPVKRIGEYAFANHAELESVTFPNSITNIGCHAFRFCMNAKFYVKSSAVKQLLIDNDLNPKKIIEIA